jgi:hypothetical protein
MRSLKSCEGKEDCSKHGYGRPFREEPLLWLPRNQANKLIYSHFIYNYNEQVVGVIYTGIAIEFGA